MTNNNFKKESYNYNIVGYIIYIEILLFMEIVPKESQ
jgi:hypothetical protein